MVWKKHSSALWWLSYCLLSLILLTACSASSPTSPPNTKESPTVLTPTPPPLNPVSEHCPPGPIPQKVSPDLGLAIGGNPLWAAGFDGPHAAIHISPQAPYTQYGWQVKILWAIEPNYTHPVTLQGTNLETGSPIYFRMTDQSTRSPVLDPSMTGTPPGKWVGFPSYIFIPISGCYSLKASWPGGQWHVTFAAGL